MVKIFIFSFILYSSLYLYSQDNINWFYSFDDAIEEAKTIDVPLMINISSNLNDQEKSIFTEKTLIDNSTNFVALKLDTISYKKSSLDERYGALNTPYVLYIDANTMDVLDRLDDDDFSHSKLLDSMKKAITTKEMLGSIKNTDKPTIEALDFYINQNNADIPYQMLIDVIQGNGELYSVNDDITVYNIDEKSKAFYFDKIANIYLHQYNDLDNTIKSYMSLIKYCSSEKEYVNIADTNIIKILKKQEDIDGLINHINQILSRKDISMEHQMFYLDMVLEIEHAAYEAGL